MSLFVCSSGINIVFAEINKQLDGALVSLADVGAKDIQKPGSMRVVKGKGVTYTNLGAYLVTVQGISNEFIKDLVKTNEKDFSSSYIDTLLGDNPKVKENLANTITYDYTLTYLDKTYKRHSFVFGDSRFNKVVYDNTMYPNVYKVVDITGSKSSSPPNQSPNNINTRYYEDWLRNNEENLVNGFKVVDYSKEPNNEFNKKDKGLWMECSNWQSAIAYCTDKSINSTVNNKIMALASKSENKEAGVSKGDINSHFIYSIGYRLMQKNGESEFKYFKEFTEKSRSCVVFVRLLAGSAYVGEDKSTYYNLSDFQLFNHYANSTKFDNKKNSGYLTSLYKLGSPILSLKSVQGGLNSDILYERKNWVAAIGSFSYYFKVGSDDVVHTNSSYKTHLEVFQVGGKDSGGGITLGNTLMIKGSKSTAYGAFTLIGINLFTPTPFDSYVRILSGDRDISGYRDSDLETNDSVLDSKEAKDLTIQLELLISKALIKSSTNKDDVLTTKIKLLSAKDIDNKNLKKNIEKIKIEKLLGDVSNPIINTTTKLKLATADNAKIKIKQDGIEGYPCLGEKCIPSIIHAREKEVQFNDNTLTIPISVLKTLSKSDDDKKYSIISIVVPFKVVGLNKTSTGFLGVREESQITINSKTVRSNTGYKFKDLADYLGIINYPDIELKCIGRFNGDNSNFAKDTSMEPLNKSKHTGGTNNFVVLGKVKNLSGKIGLKAKRIQIYKNDGKAKALVDWEVEIGALSKDTIKHLTWKDKKFGNGKIYLAIKPNAQDKEINKNIDINSFNFVKSSKGNLASQTWEDRYVRNKNPKGVAFGNTWLRKHAKNAVNKAPEPLLDTTYNPYVPYEEKSLTKFTEGMYSAPVTVKQLEEFGDPEKEGNTNKLNVLFQTECDITGEGLKLTSANNKNTAGISNTSYDLKVDFNNTFVAKLCIWTVDSQRLGDEKPRFLMLSSMNSNSLDESIANKTMDVKVSGLIRANGRDILLDANNADVSDSGEYKRGNFISVASVGVLAQDGEEEEKDTWKPEPFSYHSMTNPEAYGELKANEPRNEDWNVLGGVPSTERLFVAVGGKQFNVDVSGMTARQKNVTRTIKFKFTLPDSWGSNEPDNLSKTEHTIWSDSESDSVSATGDGGFDTKTFKDGVTISATGYTVSEGDPPSPVNKTSTANYSWSLSLIFNDANGEFKFDGDHGSGGGAGIYQVGTAPKATCTTPSKMNKWGQAYFMTEPATITKGSYTGKSSVVQEQSLVNYGYTVGLGSTHSENTNAFHRITENYEISFQEEIPEIYYLNIKNYAVSGLYKSELTNFDNNVFTSGPTNIVAQQLQATAFNIIGEGEYQSYNGRLWFTKPPQVEYKTGAGWNSTAVNYQYWLGDMVVDINTVPDYRYGELNDGKLHSNGVRRNAGCDDDGGSPTGGPSNKWHGFGGELTEEAKNTFATAVVPGDATRYPSNIFPKFCSAVANAWMNANNAKYSAAVISDSLMIGSLDNPERYQDIVSSEYWVDSGVDLFKEPFTSGLKPTVVHKDAKKNVNRSMLRTPSSDYDYQTVIDERDITFDGYYGVVTDNYDNKYRRKGDIDMRTETNIPLLRALCDEALLIQKFTKDPNTKWYHCAPTFKANGDTAYAYLNPEQVTKCEIVTSGAQGAASYDGYYEKYDLVGAKDEMVSVGVTGNHRSKRSNIADAKNMTSNNSAKLNMDKYGMALVHSNLLLKETARNGKYISPVDCTVYYGSMIEDYDGGTESYEEPGKRWPRFRRESIKAEYFRGYGNEDGVTKKINSLVIHDPVSVQYCKVVDYPNHVLSKWHIDEHDLRVPEQKISRTGTKYCLIGTEMEIFYSDIGDFHDKGGKAAQVYVSNERAVGNDNRHINTDKPEKEIVVPGLPIKKNDQTAGYVNSLDTGRWVKERYIVLPFPCYIYDKNGNKVTYGEREPIDISTFGPKSKYDATMVNEENPDSGIPGWVVKVFVLTSSNEVRGGLVQFLSVAINKPNELIGEIENTMEKTNKTRYTYAAKYDTYKDERIDVVGRIGNMSASDSQDFRFSNLFKTPINSWWIPGVIRNVDVEAPNSIVADNIDILMNPANGSTMGHATEGLTYLKGKEDTYNNGLLNRGVAKANGKYTTFPLTPAKNNIPEFRRDPMKMGYYLFLDIETMGNYYGQAEGNEDQSRIRGIEITPNYIFYDLDTKSYIPIDIYFGNKSKELIYEYGSNKIDKIKYEMKLADEYSRLNIPKIEEKATDDVIDSGLVPSTKTFRSKKADMIGHVNMIQLDQYNRDFIGSSILHSGFDIIAGRPELVAKTDKSDEQVSWNQPWKYNFTTNERRTINEEDFRRQNQRWFWKVGLPSSSLIVPHGPIPEGYNIETYHERFKKEHPHGFILNGVDILSKGDVWDLKYNGEFINNGWIDYDVPEKPGDPNPPTVPRKIPGPKVEGGVDWRRLAWIVAYDAWNTSAKDKDTKGTH